jgi:hypothetical protein
LHQPADNIHGQVIGPHEAETTLLALAHSCTVTGYDISFLHSQSLIDEA